ncbi:MAG: 50S ribosomal protein L11 methyltransferase [Desulfuromonadia bacterium]
MSRRFEPFSVGKFTITPADRPVTPGNLPIVLGEKGAFGSGEHETTASCLEMVSELSPLHGLRVLDVGSGTGILSIAALRCGCDSAVALDCDAAAARVCRENGVLNGYDSTLLSIQGTLESLRLTPSFDLVMANIYLEILMDAAGSIIALTRPGGKILLSGIPLQDKFDIQRCYHRLGAREIDSRIGEEFATYLFTRT